MGFSGSEIQKYINKLHFHNSKGAKTISSLQKETVVNQNKIADVSILIPDFHFYYIVNDNNYFEGWFTNKLYDYGLLYLKVEPIQ